MQLAQCVVEKCNLFLLFFFWVYFPCWGRGGWQNGMPHSNFWTGGACREWRFGVWGFCLSAPKLDLHCANPDFYPFHQPLKRVFRVCVSNLLKIDVVSSWILDENLNGISDGFFDNVIKHTDFPLEDVEDNNLTEDWDASFQLLELPSSDVLEGFPSSFCGKICNDILTPPRSPPKNEDKPKVKASPTQSSINATSNRSTPHCQTSRSKDSSLCHTSASVSILDSSSSGSIENSLPFSAKIFIPVKRARSKRVHRPMLYPRVNMPFAFSTSRASDKHRSAATSKRLSESDPSKKINYGKRKENNRHWLPGVKEVTSPSPSSFPARKCMHCEVTKTPQWREGPMGPKTLCNACGVRYRSGRLFPEYRPAASPTFVASLHSNSHRKVIEMRKKANHESRFVEVGNLRRPQVRISDGCVPASI